MKTSDSFVNHFDGHFAYLKTLDFYFKDCYFYQQAIPGNTTANAACGQQLTWPACNTALRLRGMSR